MTSANFICQCILLLVFSSIFIVSSENLHETKQRSQNAEMMFVQDAKLFGYNLLKPKPADFNITYNDTVTENNSVLYRYNVSSSASKKQVVRISTTGTDSEKEFPTIVVVRQERSVMSWQIPLLLQESPTVYEYKEVSRTLCPVDTYHEGQRIYVEISTEANRSVPYSLTAVLLDTFIIETDIDHHVISSPSKPMYFMYTFPQGVQWVLVRAQSDDMLCAVMSIQETKCPVFDLARNVEYQGIYQTMTRQGAITIDRSKYSSGAFFVVIVVKSNDNDCGDGLNELQPAGSTLRKKSVQINIREIIPSSQYYKAVLAAISVFVAFYLVAILIGIFYHGCKENWGIIDLPTYERSMSQDETRRPIIETSDRLEGGAEGYGSMSNPASNAERDNPHTDQGNSAYEDVDSLDSEDFDFVKDADHDKNIFRTKTALYVCDLARKSEKRADKNYKLYCKNLLTIAVFYGLPVVQLVMTYQKVLNVTGDQDICYYNFACAHPLGRVSAFNNIFSNIGYVLLGVLFVMLVYRREWLHKKAVEKSEGRHKTFGIPQHFGLFYAMGFALCMEGIMSGCYHVCPTVNNFQFDTSFMYIIACLCILKIYQNRHPDISAKAHSSYLVMAIVIIIAVIGVVYGTNIFWILFAIVYMLASLVLSVHLYYMGRWKLDRYICKRLWLLIISDWIICSRPVYLNRLILLILGNAVNWGIALYGAISAPSDYASLLLGVFIINLAIYMVYYIFMKSDWTLQKFCSNFTPSVLWQRSLRTVSAIYGATKNKSSDFASFLLAIFIGNLLLYTMFYIVSKLMAKERIPKLTISFILLAGVSWTFSLYFFFQNLTNWKYTPAGSRAGNQECLLFQFYDQHDIWHFLSAISLFFSFLVLLTLDDEIILKRRDQIPVF